MTWKLERRNYIRNTVVRGILYDHEGKEICHTLENMEHDETTGFMRCLCRGEYELTVGMLAIGAGAYGRSDCRIVVGGKHPSVYVKDCLLHSATVYETVRKRIRQYERRHKNKHIKLEVV